MPVPLPDPEAILPPPADNEGFDIARAIVTAIEGPEGLTDLQYHVMTAHCVAMSGTHINPDFIEPMHPEEFAELMRYRTEDFRVRMVQVMLLGAFILNPIPEEIVQRIADYARELSVDDDMIRVAMDEAHGARGQVMADFARAGYHAHLDLDDTHVDRPDVILPDHWASVEDDPVLAGRWAAMEHLPPNTLGRQVWQFYTSRGFHFPGSPGSASPYLAQHDWVHVIADYGSTIECEIEIFGLISRANDDSTAFSLLAMVLSLFETGSLEAVAIFEQDQGNLSKNSRKMGVRLADAMYRGAIIGARFGGGDLMDVDWLSLADRDIDEIRAMLGIPPKSPVALRSGSVSPWAPGGISPYQMNSGREMAALQGREYNSFGGTAVEQLTAAVISSGS